MVVGRRHAQRLGQPVAGHRGQGPPAPGVGQRPVGRAADHGGRAQAERGVPGVAGAQAQGSQAAAFGALAVLVFGLANLTPDVLSVER